MNPLYYGDNLKILRDYIKGKSIDLIDRAVPFRSAARLVSPWVGSDLCKIDRPRRARPVGRMNDSIR